MSSFGGIPFSIVELTLLFEILSDAGCGPTLKKVGVVLPGRINGYCSC
ncbi:hypothetical protein Hanom_Chr06g00483911 [Helianthus anomalus]